MPAIAPSSAPREGSDEITTMVASAQDITVTKKNYYKWREKVRCGEKEENTISSRQREHE